MESIEFFSGPPGCVCELCLRIPKILDDVKGVDIVFISFHELEYQFHALVAVILSRLEDILLRSINICERQFSSN